VHTPTSQLVSDKSKEAARGLVSCYAAITDQLGELTFFAFRYDDRYVREGGHWRFARRHIHHTTGILPHSGLSS
jgi:hypothetical protein